MLTQVSWCKACEAYIFLLFFFSYLWKKRKKRYAMIRKTNERKSIEQFLQKTPERIWDCPLIWYRKVLHDDRSDHQRNYPKNSRFVFFFFIFLVFHISIFHTLTFEQSARQSSTWKAFTKGDDRWWYISEVINKRIERKM